MIREIVKFPNPILRRKTVPVKKITKRILKLVHDMAETMYEANGAGLAAPQIGEEESIIVVDVGEGLISLLNPEIIAAEGEERDVEGCLSIPGRNEYVNRAKRVIVEGMSPTGTVKRYEAEGLLARAFQHEVDHLNGILFIDYLKDDTSTDNSKKENCPNDNGLGEDNLTDQVE